MKVLELCTKVPPTIILASSFSSASLASVQVTPPTQNTITRGLFRLLPLCLPPNVVLQSLSFTFYCKISGSTFYNKYGLCWVQTLGTSFRIRSKQDNAFFLRFFVWNKSDFLPCWQSCIKGTKESSDLSLLIASRQAKNYFISLSLGYLIENKITNFSLRQYSTFSFFRIFQIASIFYFRLSWQIKSCQILETQKISPFSISAEISQLRVTCFSTEADRLLSSGILLSASCMSYKLSSLTVLFLLALTSLIKDLILPANSPNPLQAFFLKKSSYISDKTNYLFYFQLKGYASLFFFYYSVAMKTFCLFLMSILLLYIPKNQCSIAQQVQGVSRGVTTSSFLSVMIKYALQSLEQSLGFFMSQSSSFLETSLAISPQASDQLRYLTWGSTLRDIVNEISPSLIRLTKLLSPSFQNYLFLVTDIVEGILSEKIFLPTAQQSKQTYCKFLMRSETSTSASSEMNFQSMVFVKKR